MEWWNAYLSNIYPNNGETGNFNLLNETHGKQMRVWPFKISRVKMSIMKLSCFKQYLYYITVIESNYNKKRQLNINSRLNFVQILTLSNGDRNS